MLETLLVVGDPISQDFLHWGFLRFMPSGGCALVFFLYTVYIGTPILALQISSIPDV